MGKNNPNLLILLLGSVLFAGPRSFAWHIPPKLTFDKRAGVRVPGWVYLGCYTDSVASRSLTVKIGVEGGPSVVNVEKCLSACAAQGLPLCGLEYAQECWGGTFVQNGAGPAANGDVDCSMACLGNAAETCGGSNRLDMYMIGEEGDPVPTSIPSIAPVPNGPIPDGWAFKGCWVDNYDGNGRSIANQQPDNPAMTWELCVTTCNGLGYTIAGMEYSVQCFCDNFIRNGAPEAPNSECNMPCGGSASETCGGPNRITLFSSGEPEVLPVPQAQKDGLPGSWAYKGCLTDRSTGQRTFPYQLILTKNNSAATCLSRCSEYGFGAGGMEYGEECFCGDAVDVTRNGATLVAEEQCDVACPGNATALCGGGNRITYYTWDGPALNSWDFRKGESAGEYRFLIGGVVVPLLTTQGINGKVTFVEKAGTGPPNSTGAYELDYSQINNFTAAWRTMHVKTDVFCSASLTLPDKSGRQINVGGWSLQSTFGIRLYTPDGMPGEASVNDWQEDPETLSLQNGRWYPTALMMANGTILVIGGEDGSNGAPVPTLELLPKVGPVIEFDWLRRTDPNNLYPMLAVLPSGGIFIAYWNEARILDEVTFDTTRILPNMPGAVNNPDGGRNYPLEGTMMLLPQHAPYTEHLGVLICGGSTPNVGDALDNCISMQPEAPNTKWTIERMPSKRVLTCMTALPDGTYLILNGGKKGVAGFGLAEQENLNAVLYDPTKPVHHRMSVMHNTTVARMYHSEAILLQDGRVLVSGSDPQDEDYPEEYRVEVFLPPYLLSGAARPAFVLSTKDWAYGQKVQFTVTSGSTANLRVSLLGIESSTHGNSMGQRTLFPSVSCAGQTCIVAAPPNAHVAQPGWFHFFVLDGPTPSESVFVRIGGDPAGLGDWPANNPAFAPLPGV